MAFSEVIVHLLKPAFLALCVAVILLIIRALYRLSPLHPLAQVPGPYLPRLSSLWLTYHAWTGDECTAVHRLHKQYGSIVRTGPNSVDISDGAALADIYTKNGGFRKTAFYGNFDIDGHKSIFSELVPERRAIRAKAVLPMFATGSLRAGKSVLQGIVDEFVKKCEEEAEWSRRTGKAVDLLNLTRGLAVDAVTGYLFGRAYGGLVGGEESEEKNAIVNEVKGVNGKTMTANGMVDLFVGVGRFWYLPSWAFKWVDWLDAKYGAGSAKEVGDSLELVDDFVAGIVDDAKAVLEIQEADEKVMVSGVATDSYPARLLSAGLTISETRAQCKDLIFAGTDSTGMNLATIIFFLAKHPDVVTKMKAELLTKPGVTDLMEIQALPWLKGVVKEGLRLSMANPSRLPRVVPASGWAFGGLNFPAGTEVSCTPFELHFNPSVFPNPLSFKPGRWIDKSENSEAMERDAIPFGLGPRQCIARNLATAELFLAVKSLVESGVLSDIEVSKDKIEILEWFNSHVVGGAVEVKWS